MSNKDLLEKLLEPYHPAFSHVESEDDRNGGYAHGEFIFWLYEREEKKVILSLYVEIEGESLYLTVNKGTQGWGNSDKRLGEYEMADPKSIDKFHEDARKFVIAFYDNERAKLEEGLEACQTIMEEIELNLKEMKAEQLSS